MRLLLLLLTACHAPDAVDSLPFDAASAFHEAAPGRYTAALPADALHAQLDAGGLTISDSAGALQLSTVALRGSEPRRVDCAGCAAEVVLGDGALLERWSTFDNGLAQRWTLDSSDEALFTLALDTHGAALHADGEDIALTAPDGSRWRYGGLRAWDAADRPLDAWMEPAGDQILLHVDLADAAFPVQIDPVLTTATSTLTPSLSGVQFGLAVAGVGDVNNDGYDDVLVGAPATSTYSGAAYLYLGSEGPGAQGGLSATPSVTIIPTSLTTYSYFGAAVAGAGDVNGDGYGDVLVGAYGYNGATGRAYLFLGNATGVSTTIAATLTGAATNSFFGASLDGAGDVNGDGYDDVVIGAYGYSSYAGRVTVYHGGASGLATTAATTLNGAASAYFGRSVAGMGDANNDGYGDIAVGAHRVSSVGQVTVYHGGASGLATTAATTLSGSGTNAQFGYSIDGAGDTDDDGYDDLVVGAYGANSYTGQVTVYPGGASGVRSTAASTLNGSNSADYFGAAVRGVGDVDLDGFDDIAVGAYGSNALIGAAFVYTGSASGTVSAVDTTLTGSGANSSFGQALDGAGDVNGDGFTDLVVGAPGLSSNSGSASVYHGYSDHDGDGVIGAEDCDDNDPTVSGPALAYADSDGDSYGDPNTTSVVCIGGGWVADATDCDDADAAVNPTASEQVGDGVDSDCDGGELCYTDADGDGASTVELLSSSDPDCADAGEASNAAVSGDCDDHNSTIRPGATEQTGDEVDSDCDTREQCFQDRDGDGYRVSATVQSPDASCREAGEAPAGAPDGDCDDDDAAIHPGVSEQVGDGVDSDCDGGELCLSDLDSDGFRTDIERTSSDSDCEDPGEALSALPGGDCDDSDSDINPDAFELVGDGLDANCDGVEDCYADADQDSWRSETVQPSADLDCDDPGEREDDGRAADCDDQDPNIHPEAEESTGDLIDSNCDGREDCFLDADGDGHRTDATIASADLDCEDVAEGDAALPADDCDDFDADVYPAAPEIAGDGEDQDCDGADLPPEEEPEDTGGEDDDKGCASAPALPRLGLALLAALALRRGSRRR